MQSALQHCSTYAVRTKYVLQLTVHLVLLPRRQPARNLDGRFHLRCPQV